MTDYGKQKSDRYAFAHSRIQEAMEASFYLEAITITESMISDRLLASGEYLGVRNARAGLAGAEKHLKNEKLARHGLASEGKTLFQQLEAGARSATSYPRRGQVPAGLRERAETWT